MDYVQAREYVSSANSLGILPGLDTIRALLKELGNPHDKLKFIHIAGTNGKGSVGAYLSFILAASGYRVGRYLSPAVFDEREIIQIIEGVQVSLSVIERDAAARHISMIEDAVGRMEKKGLSRPTAFEIETAMAFLEFLEKECDIVVLEAGLGGRLDATNIVENVECSVIVSISRDHMAFLGNTLKEIAEEKAGIIKNMVPVISSPQKPEVEEILKKRAEEKHAEIRFVDVHRARHVLHVLNGREHSRSCGMGEGKKGQKQNGIYFTYMGQEPWEAYVPLLGTGQVENALAALYTAEILKDRGYHITEETMREGLAQTVWQGRFQIVKEQPLLIVDGAHNEAAAERLAESVRKYIFEDIKEGKGKLIYVLGIFQDKEVEKIIERTAEMADMILTVKPDSPRGLSSYELKKRVEAFWIRIGKNGYAENCGDVKHGLKRALQMAEKEDTIIVFGSLSLLHGILEI